MKKPLPPIVKRMSWKDMFGAEPKDIDPETRRVRWEEWKSLMQTPEEIEIRDFWAKDHVEATCSGCRHRDEGWCNWSGLPCNINPILTIQAGVIGMACMGLGKEVPATQLKLFPEEKTYDPF